MKFILVTAGDETAWPAALSEALAPVGQLKVVSADELPMHLGSDACAEVVIVDSTAVRDIPGFIASTLAACPQASIVVATASPTWTRAREAFLAGATDYVRKSADVPMLRHAFENLISNKLSGIREPSGPRRLSNIQFEEQ